LFTSNVPQQFRHHQSDTPFGEKRIDPSANRDDVGFTGHITDTETGLTYMHARYYDPVIGRFLSPDPVGFAEAGPGYFNRYAYVMNDPVNATDPTGMYARGSGWTDEEWNKFNEAQNAAAEAAEGAVDNLKALADEIAAGGELSAQASATPAEFESVFGSGTGTIDNVHSVTAALSGAADRLNSSDPSQAIAHSSTAADWGNQGHSVYAAAAAAAPCWWKPHKNQWCSQCTVFQFCDRTRSFAQSWSFSPTPQWHYSLQKGIWSKQRSVRQTFAFKEAEESRPCMGLCRLMKYLCSTRWLFVSLIMAVVSCSNVPKFPPSETPEGYTIGHEVALPNDSQIGSSVALNDYVVHISVRDKSIDFKIENLTDKTICVPNGSWPNRMGFLDTGGDNLSIQVEEQVFRIKDRNLGHCPRCAYASEPGKGLKASVPFAEFGLPESQTEKTKQVTFRPPTPFYCKPNF